MKKLSKYTDETLQKNIQEHQKYKKKNRSTFPSIACDRMQSHQFHSTRHPKKMFRDETPALDVNAITWES